MVSPVYSGTVANSANGFIKAELLHNTPLRPCAIPLNTPPTVNFNDVEMKETGGMILYMELLSRLPYSLPFIHQSTHTHTYTPRPASYHKGAGLSNLEPPHGTANSD